MKPARFGTDAGPWDEARRWLVLAPHPDDFEVVAVTMRGIARRGALYLRGSAGHASRESATASAHTASTTGTARVTAVAS